MSQKSHAQTDESTANDHKNAKSTDTPKDMPNDADTGNDDAKGKKADGEDYKKKYIGLSRKFTEVTENLKALREDNASLRAKFDELYKAVADDGDDDGGDVDPLEAIIKRVDQLSDELERQRREAANAKFEAERIKMLTEFGVADFGDVIARADDLEAQREIISKFAEALGEVRESAKNELKRSRSVPPNVKKPAPKNVEKSREIEALRDALTKAMRSGNRDEIDNAAKAYYAAIDDVIDPKWKFGG